MPVRSSGYFNNPEFAQAAANLSSLFAPPTGTDANGWAEANAKNAAASRLSLLFNQAGNPNVDRQTLDRQSVIANLYDPTQSYYAQDQKNATDQRGQNITANTSITNNQADNVRALQQTNLQQTGDTTRAMLAPVAKDATRFVPGPLADLYGTGPTQIGVISAQPGETNTLPDGRVVAGTPKPLTDSEVKGAILQGLPQQQQQDSVLGAQTPVQVVGPDGKTPQYSSPGAAVRTGAQPFNAAAEAKPLVEGTALVNGKTTQVFRKADSETYTTADGAPIPPMTQVFEKARPVGTSDQIGMKPSEFTTKNGMFGVRAQAADANMNDISDNQKYVPSALDYEMSSGVGQKNLPTSASNAMISPQGRQFYNAADNFVLSTARPDTGAAISNDEKASMFKMYVPLPNDDPATIAQKRQARGIVTAALSANSAGAAEATLQYFAAHNVPVPAELQHRLDEIRASAADQGAASQPGATAPAPAADTPVASAAPKASAFQEGQTARDPKTGHTIVFRGGQWVAK